MIENFEIEEKTRIRELENRKKEMEESGTFEVSRILDVQFVEDGKIYTVRKNTRYSKRKLEWKNVAKLSNIMLKGYQITKKIKSFPTEFFKNQPEVSESRMAVKGLNWIRSKNQHHFEKPTF